MTKFYLTTMTYNSAVLIESGDLFNVTEGYIVTTEASRSVPYQMKLIKKYPVYSGYVLLITLKQVIVSRKNSAIKVDSLPE